MFPKCFLLQFHGKSSTTVIMIVERSDSFKNCDFREVSFVLIDKFMEYGP